MMIRLLYFLVTLSGSHGGRGESGTTERSLLPSLTPPLPEEAESGLRHQLRPGHAQQGGRSHRHWSLPGPRAGRQAQPYQGSLGEGTARQSQ